MIKIYKYINNNENNLNNITYYELLLKKNIRYLHQRQLKNNEVHLDYLTFYN